ncbi:FtsX-like permease family protein [Glaciibacter sp. 2TAF33]|uniref:FtsX-like permease family protein n=1 Tax=Glaciibacter sp. 2TAF33 TaxID=3233015 RepID=UPI003F92DCDB
MASGSLTAKRARARFGLLAAVFAVVLVTSFLLAGISGFLEDSARTGIGTVLAHAPARDAAVQVRTTVSDDPHAQSTAVEALIRPAVRAGDASASRTLRTGPLPLATPGPERAGSAPLTVVLGSDPLLAERARLVDGAWPGDTTSTDSAIPASLQADAAGSLGLAVGDVLTVGAPEKTVTFRLTATWLPIDVGAPYWFGDPAVASGFAGGAIGPLILDHAELGRLRDLLGAPTAYWTVAPDAASIQPEQLPGLSEALDRLEERVRDDTTLAGDSASVSGNLNVTISRMRNGLGAAQGVAAVPVLLVMLIAVITLIQLARLLASVRQTEFTLLRARGASVGRLTAVHAAEAAVVALPAAGAGASTAVLLFRTAGFDNAGAASSASALATPAPWLIAAAVCVVSVVVAAASTWRSAARAFLHVRDADSGRATTAATVGAGVLIAGAAALSLWQFRLYGSPLATGADGSTHIDPVAALAPALCLLTLALLVLLLFGPLLRLVQAAAARTRGISFVLPTRQVVRRIPVFAVAVLLVTLSSGGTTLAAAYAARWAALDSTAASIRNGSDVRVRQETPRTVGAPESLITATRYASLDHVEAAIPALSSPVSIATDEVTLTALSTANLPAVVRPGGSIDPIALAAAFSPAPAGIVLTDVRDTVSVTVSVPQDAVAAPVRPGHVDAFAWVADADGGLLRLPLGRMMLADPTAGSLGSALPAGAAPWSLLAFEAVLADSDGATGVRVQFEVAGNAPYLTTVAWNHPVGRLMTRGDDTATELPVVLTEDLAKRIGASGGDSLSFLLSATGESVRAIVAGTAPAIPGSTATLGILADLPALNDHLLRAGDVVPQLGDVWIRVSDATGAAGGFDAAAASVARASTLLPHYPARVSTTAGESGGPLLRPVVTVLWSGMAGALLLAVIAVLSVTVTLIGSRSGEVIVLRALGISDRAQARSRTAELSAVVISALLLGVLAGFIVSWLTVGDLAGAAVSGAGSDPRASAALRVPPGFDAAEWAALLAGFLVALAGVALSYGHRVRCQAADRTSREETR